MLNTATWTRATAQSHSLNASPLIEDFEETDELAIAFAIGLSHPSLPEKPYVHGVHATAAKRLRDTWNRMHPEDPMP